MNRRAFAGLSLAAVVLLLTIGAIRLGDHARHGWAVRHHGDTVCGRGRCFVVDSLAPSP